MREDDSPIRKAIFLDKDGTLITDVPYNVNPDLIDLEKTALEAIKLMKEQRFLLVVISNQSGVAKGYFKEEELVTVWNRISALLQKHGLSLDAFYYCPHEPKGTIEQYAILCDCRKPLPGLILKAAAELKIDLAQSWMIGDILNDVEAGNRAGCGSILINNENETEWVMDKIRTPDFTANNLLEAASFIKMQRTKKMHYEL
jgi:D-glycero-D-manno-heptose 1,7-bisphosphate phosphatase